MSYHLKTQKLNRQGTGQSFTKARLQRAERGGTAEGTVLGVLWTLAAEATLAVVRVSTRGVLYLLHREVGGRIPILEGNKHCLVFDVQGGHLARKPCVLVFRITTVAGILTDHLVTHSKDPVDASDVLEKGATRTACMQCTDMIDAHQFAPSIKV